LTAPGRSREHSNFEPVSFEEKAKLALVAVVVPLGPLASRVVEGRRGSSGARWARSGKDESSTSG
jgi:hypothetical protein